MTIIAGVIQFELLDSVSCYSLDYIHHQVDDIKSAVVLQFHLKAVIDNDLPANRFKKFMNKDELFVYIHSVHNIDWQNKDSVHCLEGAQLGVSEDDGKQGGVDHTICAVLDL